MNKNRYREYLRTSHWKMFRDRVVLRTYFNGRYKCESCLRLVSRNELDVHHLHYRSLWHEQPSDVKVICHECHAEAHGKSPGERKVSGSQDPFSEIMAIAYEQIKPFHKRLIDGVISQKQFDAIKREFIDMLLSQKNL